jgi:predicted ATP-binding protein involved in virulence
MRIDLLTIQNFKKFTDQTFTFHPQFTLLVGDNGAGKTSLLDALAVSMAVWLVDAPDSSLQSSRRNILPTEIRLEPAVVGDRTQFRERLPVRIQATGRIGDHEHVTWTRQVKESSLRTSNAEAKPALTLIEDIYRRDAAGELVLCPVLAYYGAGRAWLPSTQRLAAEPKLNGPARRWAAFQDCLDERIRFEELRAWFHRETTAAGVRGGRMRPGFEAVRRAVLACVPDADDLWYDPDRAQIVLAISGNPQPFDNLSAGQRMMMAVVADIAIKAVIQNAYLLPPDELGPEDNPLPRVLRQTPGIVLIDELDVHLHPKWQRRVATDLKATFPSIQFVCTSHSPQIIGELPREQIRLLDEEHVETPTVALGADSNWILDHVMQGASMNLAARQLRDAVENALVEGDLSAARQALRELRHLLDGDTAELVLLESSLYALEAIGANGDNEGAP